MTYEMYRLVFIIAAVLCAVMFMVSAFLFFALRIRDVIGDLNGSNARKAIEEIRSRNEQSGEKVYKSSAVNKKRGALTDKISPSGRLERQSESAPYSSAQTEKIATSKLMSDETTLLSAANNSGQATEVLPSQTGETTVLGAGSVGETVLLSEIVSEVSGEASFGVEFDITYIHSSEWIE